MEKKNIVVVGGGAAGFYCAIQIAELHPDWQITIVEKTSKLLSKVRVSGGGRCNVTHACPEVDQLIQKYPRGQRFLKKSFYQFATAQTIEWFAKNEVKLHTENLMSQALLDELPQLIWVKSQQNQYYYNQAMCQYIGKNKTNDRAIRANE